MSNVIKVDFSGTSPTRPIDVKRIAASARIRREQLIEPAKEEITTLAVPTHAAEPIKDLDTIDRITNWLIQNEKYRDNMLFIVGINFGLRISDLLRLRFCDLINEDFSFKRDFSILEMKTRNTRKVTKNRSIYINSAVIDAVLLYLEHNPGVSLTDYLFQSESNNRKGENRPISRQAVDLILKDINRALGIGIKMSSHTLRKTFAYHQMAMSNHDPRKLVLLQKMFGHSSVAQTLDYIGLTEEEIADAYTNLNLGSNDHYKTYCKLYEYGS